MKGQVTAVRIEGDRIIQTFGSKGRALTPSYKADHYMYYQGGELSFGKTTMHGADLEIIDADPKAPSTSTSLSTPLPRKLVTTKIPHLLFMRPVLASVVILLILGQLGQHKKIYSIKISLG